MVERIKKLFTSTASRHGSYSVGLMAIAVCIVIVVNLIVGQLPESIRNIDISDNRIYEISDTSKEMLNALDQEITFTVYAEKSSTDEMIRIFLEKYADLSDKIKVEWVDPVLHPAELEEKEVSEDTILIESETTGKSRAVAFSDILLVDDYTYYMTGSTDPSEFDGEGQFTAAINYVTSEATKTIYYTSGHGENTFSSSVFNLLVKNNYTTEELNLLMATEIPEDCDLLFMYAPTTDITEDELTMIQDYMATGGNVMLVLGTMDDAENLDALLGEYGMVREDGYIADMQRCYQGNYYYIFPELQSVNGITDGLDSDMVLLVDAHGMTLTDAARDTITVTEIMSTSSDGYAVTEDEQKQGIFTLGAVASETIGTSADSEEVTEGSTDTEELTSHLTVFSSDSLIDNQITDAFSTLDNLNLFIGAVSSNFNDVENVAIEAKSLEVTYNTMQYAGIISILIIFGIPIVILVLGFVKWWRRRKA